MTKDEKQALYGAKKKAAQVRLDLLKAKQVRIGEKIQTTEELLAKCDAKLGEGDDAPAPPLKDRVRPLSDEKIRKMFEEGKIDEPKMKRMLERAHEPPTIPDVTESKVKR